MRIHWMLPCLALLTACAQLPPAPGGEEAHNMRLVGYSDLQGRTAYQPTLQQQGNRWIAYVGHHGDLRPNPLNGGKAEDNGTSIVDVTDPRQPRYLAHIPGEPGQAEQGGAQMVRVCAGAQLPRADKGKFYMLRTFGNQAHEIWDVTVPEKPALLTTVVRGLKGTHKNFWECLHGPISTGPKGNRVYFGYGTSTDGVLQIVDRTKLLNGPKEPTPANLLAPQVGRADLPPMHGAHTVFPLLQVDVPEFAKAYLGRVRDFVVITDEAIQKECLEGRQMVWIVDVSTESKPFGVANYTVPEASGNFCSRGGRFGTHSSNENMAPVFYKRLMFFAHFNAGVRAVDVRNPLAPKEVGWYIPAMNANTVVLETPASQAASALPFTDASKRKAIQTNNVEIDERGYIYIVDRANSGMHILELTGPARDIADWGAAQK